MQAGRDPHSGNQVSVLGLSSFDHDTAAALLANGGIAAAIENDKLARAKTMGLPQAAIRFCLGSKEDAWERLSAVAVASSALHKWFRQSCSDARLAIATPMASAYHQFNAIGELRRQWEHMRLLRRLSGKKISILAFDHHLCHAANAFYSSPFERALVITMDERGDGCSGMLALGEGTSLRSLRRVPFPHSLAWLYTQVTELSGFVPHKEEYKTQWFGMTGTPDYKALLLEVLGVGQPTLPRINSRFTRSGLDRRLGLSSEFYRRAELPSEPRMFSDEQRRALARSVQEACCEVILMLVDQLWRTHGQLPVCFAGGLFQNPVLVATLEEKLSNQMVFVPPAPGNSGTALGSAFLAWHGVLNQARIDPISSPYWGPRFSSQEAKDILDNCKARYTIALTEEQKSEYANRLLAAGKIIGWVQGEAEFGPRALGNRSLLASPWAPYVQENLNEFIKHREGFRPFAISVAEEDCPKYFDASQNCQFMNSLGRLQPGAVCLPASFLLPDGRVRLHIVRKKSNPLLWALLKGFGKHAPAPVLVNTSFNLFGEPLVVTPRDAIRSFFGSGIDALLINNFVLAKHSAAPFLERMPVKQYAHEDLPPVASSAT
jgi:carbamoyltransferase